jgi:hypothetical protein
MKSVDMRLLRRISLSTFGVGATLMVVSTMHGLRQTSTEPAVAFTLKQNQVVFASEKSDGELRATRVRHQASDGRFKLVHRKELRDEGIAREKVTFRLHDVGVVFVDEGQQLLSLLHPESGQLVNLPSHSADIERKPSFRGTAKVLGWDVLIDRVTDHEGKGYVDHYCAIDLGGFPIKEVHVRKDGTMVMIEPTEITVGAPPESLFESVPDYPLSYELYRMKIGVAAKRNPEFAEQMRGWLANYQESHKGARALVTE